jgi:hypothetical protein
MVLSPSRLIWLDDIAPLVWGFCSMRNPESLLESTRAAWSSVLCVDLRRRASITQFTFINAKVGRALGE